MSASVRLIPGRLLSSFERIPFCISNIGRPGPLNRSRTVIIHRPACSHVQKSARLYSTSGGSGDDGNKTGKGDKDDKISKLTEDVTSKDSLVEDITLLGIDDRLGVEGRSDAVKVTDKEKDTFRMVSCLKCGSPITHW
ncbi:uncharacterized protein LOC127879946 isoform X2 [Dreissena polymorpha]|uniref:uncharacterized protein LOC127879946 isoform X2 n=1 Tax=Dreissena polymorpha TaxID=45954 RepID=UPI00226455B3|nr:uncharacterized protein LOC127879946 isoform X2 [Dreissena polymorpha]